VFSFFSQNSFASDAGEYMPPHWAAIAHPELIQNYGEVAIEAVAARANFDNFLSSFITVYILYTQTDWPGEVGALCR
jgi:hypothetical protein